MRTSFLTGSRVYGQPTKESDVDLVVRLSQTDAGILASVADHVCSGTTPNRDNNYEGLARDDNMTILRFGQLNLICCHNNEWMVGWKKATDVAEEESIREGKRLPKWRSVEIFKGIFKTLGCNDRR